MRKARQLDLVQDAKESKTVQVYAVGFIVPLSGLQLLTGGVLHFIFVFKETNLATLAALLHVAEVLLVFGPTRPSSSLSFPGNP